MFVTAQVVEDRIGRKEISMPSLIMIMTGLACLRILYEIYCCVYKPEKCKDLFMSTNGFTISLVAKLSYPGQPEVARRDIVVKARLRSLFILELVIRAIFLISVSILIVVSNQM